MLVEKALQITFRGMEPSDAVRAKIEEKAARLDKVCDRITGCRVVVEAPHRHHQKGMLFQVRIDLSVPAGAFIVVNGEVRAVQTLVRAGHPFPYGQRNQLYRNEGGRFRVGPGSRWRRAVRICLRMPW